jgi:hypothetical protein
MRLIPSQAGIRKLHQSWEQGTMLRERAMAENALANNDFLL